MAAAGSVVVAWSATGEAQPIAGVDVRWVAPARCPGPDDVQARVRRLLGPRAQQATRQEPLVAEATVVTVDGRYRLTLTVRTVRQGDEPSGVTRTFESASCESLAGAAAVTLALLARGEARPDGATARPSPGSPAPTAPSTTASPAAGAEGATPAGAPPAAAPEASPSPTSPPATSPSPPSPPATSPPAASPAPTAPPATAPSDVVANPETSVPLSSTTPAPSARRSSSVVLEAPLLAVDAGVLPSWAYGLGIGVGVRVNQFRVRMAGFLWLSQSGTSAARDEATYHRRTGELSGCYSWSGGAFEVGPCLAVALEDVSAGGTGPDVVSGSGHVSWLTVGVAARAGWSMRRWATLFLAPRVTLTTSRPTFAIDGVGPLYQVPRVAGGAEVGCEWIF
jgi:hypothetical protein